MVTRFDPLGGNGDPLNQMRDLPLVYNQADFATISGMTKKNMLVDTDWYTDVDDVGALRVATYAHLKGYINLLGVLVSTTQTTSAPAISAMLKADGVSAPIASGPLTSHTHGSNSYNATMSALTKTVYSNTGLLDSVKLARRLLAAATTPVTWAVFGFLVNLSELLQSPADSISPLAGAQLVAAKCDRIALIGFDFTGATAEFNVAQTAQAKTATAYVLANCPVPIYALDYNEGLFPTFSNCLVNPTTSDIAAAAYNAFGATGNAGRRSWDPLLMFLACAPSFSQAGFTTTRGKIGFNATSGLSSFTPGAGTHYKLTTTINKRALQIAIDSILTPSLQPAVYPTVTEPNFASPAAAVTGLTDAANLVVQYVPADTNVADTAAVPVWPDRLGRWPLLQGTAGAQPAYAAAKVSKTAVATATDDAMSALGFVVPHPCTIYMRVLIDAAPGATATLLTINHDTVASNNARSMSVVMTTGRVPQMSVTGENTYAVDNGAAVATGAWVCLTGRVSNTDCEMFVDNVSSGGATAIAKYSNYVNGKLTIGGLFADGSIGPFTGWYGEIRIYQGAHDSAARALVIAEMAAGA